MKKLSYGTVINLIDDTVQDKDTYSWTVFKVSNDEDTIVLISEEDDLKETKVKIVDHKEFVNNFYQYRCYNKTNWAVLRRIIDIYE